MNDLGLVDLGVELENALGAPAATERAVTNFGGGSANEMNALRPVMMGA